MKNNDEIKSVCLEIMGVSEGVFVTSLGEDGYPYTRCTFNLRNSEEFPRLVPYFDDHQQDFMVLISTNTSSKKVAQLRKNPKVNLYYCHPSTFRGLMLLGDIELSDDSTLRHLVFGEGWERYYPAGPDDPDHTVLRLLPRLARGWYRGNAFEFTLNR